MKTHRCSTEVLRSLAVDDPNKGNRIDATDSEEMSPVELPVVRTQEAQESSKAEEMSPVVHQFSTKRDQSCTESPKSYLCPTLCTDCAGNTLISACILSEPGRRIEILREWKRMYKQKAVNDPAKKNE